jgi:ABC-type multidrug transport system ATPase subunit
LIVYDIHDLVKNYPGQKTAANDHIFLQINQGEIFGLLGDNGAGKSTLVRQMANLVRSTSGEIRLFGKLISADPMLVPRLVGYMPQDGLALNNLTVKEAIYFTAHLRGMSRRDALRECERLLELWNIGHLRDKVNIRLSGGQKRLLQLAVALAGSPSILILDEPTNDLDPQRRKEVWETLRQINRDQGTSVIFITHDALEAEKIIQRVGIMRLGKIAAIGKSAELKSLVDQKLRLELFFSPGNPPCLLEGLTPIEIDQGRWLVYLDRSQVSSLLQNLELSQVDDFRLYSATLEDLYLYYANRQETPPISHPAS